MSSSYFSSTRNMYPVTRAAARKSKKKREKNWSCLSNETGESDKIKHLFPCFALRDLASSSCSSSRFFSSLIRVHRFTHFTREMQWLDESNVMDPLKFYCIKNRLIVFTLSNNFLFVIRLVEFILIERLVREISFDIA